MLALLFIMGYMLVGFMIFLSISIMILRGAITLTNAIFGGAETVRDCDYELDMNSWGTRLRNPNGFVIPDPSFGHAAAAVILPGAACALITGTVTVIFKGFAFLKRGPEALTQAVNDVAHHSIMIGLIPVLILIRLGIMAGMLRTTMLKAFAVVVFEAVIGVILLFILILILVATGQIATPSFLQGVV